MYTIQVHKRINQFMLIFSLTGLWQRDDSTAFCKWFSKIFYLVLFGCYPVLMLLSVFKNEDMLGAILTGVLSIIIIVQNVRLNYILWHKDEILSLIQKMCVHLFRDFDYFVEINNKIESFIKYVSYFVVIIFAWIISWLVIFAMDRHLPTNLYCPWDCKTSAIGFWTAFFLDSFEIMVSFMCFLFNTIIWYLMMSCAMKFRIFGNGFRTLNLWSNKQNVLLNDLVLIIKDHHNLQRYKNDFNTNNKNLLCIFV